MTDATGVLAGRARKLSASLISDASPPDVRIMSGAIRPLGSDGILVGPAFPLKCPPGSNYPLHQAVYEASPGDVLVCSVAGAYDYGYWGEILTTAALKQGLAGLVIDGCIRDRKRVTELEFQVYGRGTCVRKASKDRGGTAGDSVIVGGCTVCRGDMVIADSDSVVVLAYAEFEACLSRAEEIAAAEEAILRAVDGGRRTIDFYGPGRPVATGPPPPGPPPG